MSDTLSYDHYCLLQDSENEASVIKLYNDRLAVKFAKKKKHLAELSERVMMENTHVSF